MVHYRHSNKAQSKPVKFSKKGVQFFTLIFQEALEALVNPRKSKPFQSFCSKPLMRQTRRITFARNERKFKTSVEKPKSEQFCPLTNFLCFCAFFSGNVSVRLQAKDRRRDLLSSLFKSKATNHHPNSKPVQKTFVDMKTTR